MTDLAEILEYATALHAAEWCVSDIPRKLDVILNVDKSGPDLLGVAISRRRRIIVLNDAILGTPLEVPVLAHECAHILLGHDFGFCSATLRTRHPEERQAWMGAAILAVSPLFLSDPEAHTSDACTVPEQVVRLRWAARLASGELGAQDVRGLVTDRAIDDVVSWVREMTGRL